jgi:hypothetical protein
MTIAGSPRLDHCVVLEFDIHVHVAESFTIPVTMLAVKNVARLTVQNAPGTSSTMLSLYIEVYGCTILICAVKYFPETFCLMGQIHFLSMHT